MITMTGCYMEKIDLEPEAEVFNLYVEDSQQELIYNSRDTSYSIDDPPPKLYFNDQLLNLREIRIRGKTALRFRRKSYAVFLNEPIVVIDRYGKGTKELSRLKLLALATDYTYIENRVAFGILQEAGIMPLFFKFVLVRINDESQGVYLLMEDPEQFYKENNSEYILRRGYNHGIDDFDYQPSIHLKPVGEYLTRFNEIYHQLPQSEGKQLFDEIAARLDIESYFRKMAIDYLVKNGDYTDEIYLYSQVEKDTTRFHIIPWDYDDIFSENPHEVGVSWGMGTLFGERYYATRQDIYDEIGDKLIYSIEDDLDYSIARDPYLYDCYEKTFTGLLDIVDEHLIDQVFSETREELSTFYESFAVIEQSNYDIKPTSKEKWIQNMDEKRSFLQNRLESVRFKLNNE
jgi:spore coat protein H